MVMPPRGLKCPRDPVQLVATLIGMAPGQITEGDVEADSAPGTPGWRPQGPKALTAVERKERWSQRRAHRRTGAQSSDSNDVEVAVPGGRQTMRLITGLGVSALLLAMPTSAQQHSHIAGGQRAEVRGEGLPEINHRPALIQRLETVEHGIQNAPPYMAVLGNECPDGWEPRMTADGELLYVPLGLLVNAAGEVQEGPYTLLVACERRR